MEKCTSPCVDNYCPVHGIAAQSGNAPDVRGLMANQLALDVWASADTLAFMAFIPIVRAMREQEWDLLDDLFARQLHIACGMAHVALRLQQLRGLL